MPFDLLPEAPTTKLDTSHYETVTTMDRLMHYIKQAHDVGYVSFDTETTGLDPMTAELVGFSMCSVEGEACYVPVGHDDGTPQIPLQDALDALKPMLSNPCVAIVMQNGKYDVNVLHKYGVTISYIKDTMLMANSLFGGKHRMNMDELSHRYLQHTTIKISELIGKGTSQITFDKVPVDRATAYAAEDSDVTLRLAMLFRAELGRDHKARAVYGQLEEPLIHTIARMERRGIKVAVERLRSMDAVFETFAADALRSAHSVAAVEFNPGSPQQVGEVLTRLGVRLTETTDSGQPATDVKVLEKIEKNEEVPEAARNVVQSILKFRKFAKLRGTYTQGLVAAVNQSTGRVHPSFGMASTTTGRLACSDPNLQNIPVRTPEGKLIRAAFVAEAGHKLISADYSQIELRVVAEAAGDDALLSAFEQGVDIHQATAAYVWNVPLNEVTKDQRRDAKAVNFGIVYGTSAFGLANNLGISEEAAAKIIRNYFEKFPGLKAYMENAVKVARAYGYVETMAGRKIWFPDINHRNKGIRGHAERAAVNAPIQGTAADVIKGAMLNVEDMLFQRGFKTRMLLQVHDELVFEAPDGEVEKVMPLIAETMTSSAPYLSVPLLVEAKAADNWNDAH